MLGDFDVAVSALSRFKIRLARATGYFLFLFLLFILPHQSLADLHPEDSVGITRCVDKSFSFKGEEPQASGLPPILKVFDPDTDISVLFQVCFLIFFIGFWPKTFESFSFITVHHFYLLS